MDARRWRLSALLADLWENIGDLAVHLRAHWRLIVGLAGATLMGAFLFAWSGVYTVAATSGHYVFFNTFLSFALRQSVATHTIGITAPPLDDPAMLRRGAAHYHGGCAPCHGAPGHARNPIARRMLPEPPYLADVAGQWTAPELYWIVRHGIKYAGMPAWVAPERTDEVWSVVAFLQRLKSMDPPAYGRLAFGEAAFEAPDAQENLNRLLLNGPSGPGPFGNGIAACARCHGMDGAGDPTGAFPRLNGQTEAYLFEALQSYALGARLSGIMQPVAAELDTGQMRLLATHYAGQSVPVRRSSREAAEANADVMDLGRRIATNGAVNRGVAACAACHGPSEMPLNALFPRLSGQNANYIAAQLELWMTGVRGGNREGPMSRLMAQAVGIFPGQVPPPTEALWPLGRMEIAAVAAWYAAQPSPPAEGRPP